MLKRANILKRKFQNLNDLIAHHLKKTQIHQVKIRNIITPIINNNQQIIQVLQINQKIIIRIKKFYINQLVN
jgi:hypothetical protein